MINGDISNETSPRITVHVDVVANSEVVEDKKFLRTSVERKVIDMNRLALAELWRLSDRFPMSIELVAYAEDYWTQEQLDTIMAKLDRRGANPFNYAELYDSVDEFVSDLPYRNNFKGMIDTRDRVARYGSFGIEMSNL